MTKRVFTLTDHDIRNLIHAIDFTLKGDTDAEISFYLENLRDRLNDGGLRIRDDVEAALSKGEAA